MCYYHILCSAVDETFRICEFPLQATLRLLNGRAPRGTFAFFNIILLFNITLRSMCVVKQRTIALIRSWLYPAETTSAFGSEIFSIHITLSIKPFKRRTMLRRRTTTEKTKRSGHLLNAAVSTFYATPETSHQEQINRKIASTGRERGGRGGRGAPPLAARRLVSSWLRRLLATSTKYYDT